jgi:hypothetical protein
MRAHKPALSAGTASQVILVIRSPQIPACSLTSPLLTGTKDVAASSTGISVDEGLSSRASLSPRSGRQRLGPDAGEDACITYGNSYVASSHPLLRRPRYKAGDVDAAAAVRTVSASPAERRG